MNPTEKGPLPKDIATKTPNEEWRRGLSDEARAHIERLEREADARERDQEQLMQTPGQLTETETVRAERLRLKEKLASRELESRSENEWEREKREKGEKKAALDKARDESILRHTKIETADKKAVRVINWTAASVAVAGGLTTMGTFIIGMGAQMGQWTFGLNVAETALTGVTTAASWVTPVIAGSLGITLVAVPVALGAAHLIRAANKALKERKRDAQYQKAVKHIERGGN
jgi:hypothetical protein